MSIAEKVLRAKTDYDEVYESGYEKGKSEGGADSHYDTFWDTYQDNGNRTDYSMGFTGEGWNDETYKPKYPIKPTTMESMFQQSAMTEIGYKSEIDLTNNPNVYQCFRSSAVEKIKLIDISNNTYAKNFMCGYCSKLHTIEEIRVSEKTTFVTNMFQECGALKNINITGTIGQKDLTLRHSTSLSKASVISIISALSTETEDITVTFSQTAVNNAFETSAGAADGSTSDEWKNLIATKPNWTIALG